MPNHYIGFKVSIINIRDTYPNCQQENAKSVYFHSKLWKTCCKRLSHLHSFSLFLNRFTSKKLCKQSNDAINISTALCNILKVTLTLKKTAQFDIENLLRDFFSPQFWLWLWKANHRCKSIDTNTKWYLGKTIEGWVSKKFLLITGFCGR